MLRTTLRFAASASIVALAALLAGCPPTANVKERCEKLCDDYAALCGTDVASCKATCAPQDSVNRRGFCDDEADLFLACAEAEKQSCSTTACASPAAQLDECFGAVCAATPGDADCSALGH